MYDFKLSSKSVSRLEGVDPRIKDIIHLAIQLTKVDFGIPADGGVRTSVRQHQLFTSGKSKANGFDNLSRHQIAKGKEFGQAFDVYAYIDGAASWREDHLAIVACAILQAASMLEIRLTWGGLWTSNKKTNGIPYGWDMAHFQLVD